MSAISYHLKAKEKMLPNFIVVDDDRINNFLAREIIDMVFPEAEVLIFSNPDHALGYIKSTYIDPKAPDTVLFLDINMPTLSGWQFLDQFGRFDMIVKEHFDIYMLSSSIDPRDKARAASNENVLDFIEKPLTTDILENLIGKF